MSKRATLTYDIFLVSLTSYGTRLALTRELQYARAQTLDKWMSDTWLSDARLSTHLNLDTITHEILTKEVWYKRGPPGWNMKGVCVLIKDGGKKVGKV